MSVTTHEVLQPDMGMQLSDAVRRSLVEMGTACNLAAVHMHQALSNSFHIESLTTAQRAEPATGQLARQVTGDLERLADQHFEQAIVVLARAATIYAVYASRVAEALAAGEPPPMPGSEPIRPSDLITAWGLYLPAVRFPDDGRLRNAEEQNATITTARQELTDLITHRMQGESTASYDDIAAVTTEDDGSEHRLVEFAAALHYYASVLVWASGAFGGTREQSSER